MLIYLKRGSIIAMAEYEHGGWVILKAGSTVSDKQVLPEGYVNDDNVVVKDYRIRSLEMVTYFVLGYLSIPELEWVDETGRSIRELRIKKGAEERKANLAAKRAARKQLSYPISTNTTQISMNEVERSCAEDETFFFLGGRGRSAKVFKAKGIWRDSEFFVLKDSRISPVVNDSIDPEALKARRMPVISNWVLLQDVPFSSDIVAKQFVIGCNNGNWNWHR